jgi:hypothetical protein
LAGGWSVVKTHIPEFLKSEKLTSADLEGLFLCAPHKVGVAQKAAPINYL